MSSRSIDWAKLARSPKLTGGMLRECGIKAEFGPTCAAAKAIFEISRSRKQTAAFGIAPR